MKVEIWSDVMCPFCYIGKRRFEDALAKFEYGGEIEIEWKSFQLNPLMKTNPNISIHDYLAETKGWQPEYARQLNEQVTAMAAEVGLTYNMDQAVVANSFDAHRFTHYAKLNGVGIEAEEQLFRAYFTDGKNIADHDVLAELGSNIGLNPENIKEALATNAYSDEVHYDLREAQELGISAVPFFVLDRKYAVSGAQPEVVFLDALQKAYSDQEIEIIADNTDNSCDVDGSNC
ncbi:DsbA family oxidoreductase [Mucilaginibacter jinjuensis]|uniref:DsbA family oxidoreductase n=1 Tax=Mucilaginibacter jinjuensis TaxID=1176721 RepID=A0ABY7T458_9SPHI|nr:DsbA family oxidoreductase [Mucilaginibacter jinjuensis]WCT11235.1 DsbA family oxidoreductase [Mucilaginibacter jinjuensis]